MNLSRLCLLFLLICSVGCSSRDRDNFLDPGGDKDMDSPFELEVSSRKLVVKLKWKPLNDETISGFNIYRSMDDSTFTMIDFLSKDSTVYRDSTVSEDLPYTYRISAGYADGEESKPSRKDKIIPGSSIMWMLDFSGDVLYQMTHDAAHFTGYAVRMDYPIAFDVDAKTGDTFAIEQYLKRLSIYTQDDSIFYLDYEFENPMDLAYDSYRNDLWVSDGNSGDLIRFDMAQFIAQKFHVNGVLTDIELDINHGDCWAIDSDNGSVILFRWESGTYGRLTVSTFESGNLFLAVDEGRGRAFVGDRSAGKLYIMFRSGEVSQIASQRGMSFGAVEPSTGNFWLLADDDSDNSPDLLKLSPSGSRLIKLTDIASKPSWIGVNPANENCVIADVNEGKITTLSSDGQILYSFDKISMPIQGRILYDVIE